VRIANYDGLLSATSQLSKSLLYLKAIYWLSIKVNALEEALPIFYRQ